MAADRARSCFLGGVRPLLETRPHHQQCGHAVRLFNALLSQLEARELRPTLSAFKADGTYDGERTRISRQELERFRETCGINTVALPGTWEEPRRAEVLAPAVTQSEKQGEGTRESEAGHPNAVDGPVRGNPANRLVVTEAGKMEAEGKRVTTASMWLRLGELVGKSIIEDSKPDAFLCNIGAENLHRLTKGAVRGVLDRRRSAR